MADRKNIIEKGLDFPRNDQELKWFDEAFKDYPFQLDEKSINPIKIIEMAEQEMKFTEEVVLKTIETRKYANDIDKHQLAKDIIRDLEHNQIL